MKIRKKLASVLQLTDEEKQYILSLKDKKYCRINFIIKVVIVLATIFLPIIYLYFASASHYINDEVIRQLPDSSFVLYKTIWMTHVIAVFLFIPSFLLMVLYLLIKKCKNFNSFIILRSFLVYSISLEKLFLNFPNSTLDEKIRLLHQKYIQISSRLVIISVFLFINLMFFDTNNYTIITNNGLIYKKYGAITEDTLSWQDLEKVSVGCSHNIPSYGNPFVRIKWHYTLFFNNHFVANLHDFSSLKGNYINNISIVDTIVRVLNIRNVNQNNSDDILKPKILERKCKQLLMHSYSERDYNLLANALRLEEK
jgi:hypothetical protein